MRIDSIQIAEGGKIGNLVVDSGTSFPLNPNEGELFYKTSDDLLYVYDGTQWKTVAAVTSVAASGGTTGLSFTGSPITSSGTLTLSGTLAVANGGTGVSTVFTQGSVVFAGASGAYSQNNSNLFWNNTDNRLGIGTASPSFALDVRGASGVGAQIYETSTGNNNRLIITQNGTVTNYNSTYSTGSGQHAWQIGNSEKMRLDASGNLAIGLTSTSRKLAVRDTTANAVVAFTSSDTDDVYIGLGDVSNDLASYIRHDNANGLMNIVAETAMTINTNSAERIRVDSSGNVGIGTNAPTNTLSVAGNANITGNMGVGVGPNSTIALYARGTALTGTTQTGVYSYPTGTSAATANVRAFTAQPATEASSFTVTNTVGFLSHDAIKGAGSTITNQHGFYIADQTQGTNNYGIASLVSSGSNKWNIYASGTAANYFAGNLGIGTSSPAYKFVVSNSGAQGFELDPATGILQVYNRSTSAYGEMKQYASNIRFFTGPTPTETAIFDSSGNVLVKGPGGLGYGTGSGGAVTQDTSRTTGVTLNKTNGAITLVSAAGSASWQSFTVTNSTVAASDTVIVNQKSGTDLYQIYVTAVAAGSFRITFATTGGTSTEQPVFNFAVIKAVVA